MSGDDDDDDTRGSRRGRKQPRGQRRRRPRQGLHGPQGGSDDSDVYSGGGVESDGSQVSNGSLRLLIARHLALTHHGALAGARTAAEGDDDDGPDYVPVCTDDDDDDEDGGPPGTAEASGRRHRNRETTYDDDDAAGCYQQYEEYSRPAVELYDPERPGLDGTRNVAAGSGSGSSSRHQPCVPQAEAEEPQRRRQLAVPDRSAVLASLVLRNVSFVQPAPGWGDSWFYTEDATEQFLPAYVDRVEQLPPPQPPQPPTAYRMRRTTECACMNDGEPFAGPVHTLPLRVRRQRPQRQRQRQTAGPRAGGDNDDDDDHSAAEKAAGPEKAAEPMPDIVTTAGVFCSWPCALLYARLHYSDTQCTRVRQNIMHLLGTWHLPAEAPPPERLLRKFIGARGLTIEEYRAQLCAGPGGRRPVFQELPYRLVASVSVVEGTHELANNGTPDHLLTAAGARLPRAPRGSGATYNYANRRRRSRRPPPRSRGEGPASPSGGASGSTTAAGSTAILTTHEPGIVLEVPAGSAAALRSGSGSGSGGRHQLGRRRRRGDQPPPPPRPALRLLDGSEKPPEATATTTPPPPPPRPAMVAHYGALDVVGAVIETVHRAGGGGGGGGRGSGRGAKRGIMAIFGGQGEQRPTATAAAARPPPPHTPPPLAGGLG